MPERSTDAPGQIEVKRRLSHLAGFTRSLSDATTLDELVETAAECVLEGLGSSTISLSRLEPGTGLLRTLINVGELGPTEERYPADETYSLQEFLRLRSVVNELRGWRVSVHDAEADPSEVTLLRELGKEAAIAVPIRLNNAVWGELYASYHRADGAFECEDDSYLEVYLALLEGALGRVIQIESLERLAFIDALTGLPNRRAIDEAAATAYEQLEHGDLSRLHVLSLDLNGLKQVNDTLGHSEGDRLIVSAAAAIQNAFGTLAGSMCGRVGGDEFMVLAPSHAIETVAACAHNACLAVAALPTGRGASCGIATSTSAMPEQSMLRLFQRADAAQYQSKRSGQRVVVDVAALNGLTA